MSDAVAVKPRVRAVAAAPAAAADSRAAVAVTGAACRFPLEGTTPAEMWQQLVGKTETGQIMMDYAEMMVMMVMVMVMMMMMMMMVVDSAEMMVKCF